jgi:glycosyltransferase involved in cell wall biosynthesis
MNVLVAHNRYAFRGGEDEAFVSEVALLRNHGHSVSTWVQDNAEISGAGKWIAGLRAVWSQKDYWEIRSIIRNQQIQIVSVHNFFPLISPSIYWAARHERVPIVQTLHNYRLLCPDAKFLRQGRVCEECLGKRIALPAIAHRCYRGSALQTGAIVAMNSIHRALGTWSAPGVSYIALTDFMREKFIEGGFKTDQIFVKPNSVEDTGIGRGEGDNFLFVGRLAMEKGVSVLLSAWREANPSRTLKIVGTGPEDLNLKAAASGISNIEFLGELPADRTRELIGKAAAVVFPSIWYEGLSRVVAEAFSKGTPVIASDIGPIPAIVGHSAGVIFKTGDSSDLAQKLARFPRSGQELDQKRAAARRIYEVSFSEETVYRTLIGIYDAAIQSLNETTSVRS